MSSKLSEAVQEAMPTAQTLWGRTGAPSEASQALLAAFSSNVMSRCVGILGSCVTCLVVPQAVAVSPLSICCNH